MSSTSSPCCNWRRADRWRKAFYSGLAVGLLIAAVRLAFFWRIFSGGAFALWLVYAFWIGLFVALARLCLVRLGPKWGWLLIPFVWTGLEYFRSELYYLRFSWLNAGYAFVGAPWQGALRLAGVYGIGFLLISLAAGAAYLWRKSRTRSLGLLLLGVGGICLGGLLSGREPSSQSLSGVRVAGVQMEFPTEREVLLRLNDLVRLYPHTEMVVLSEYTFGEPVPGAVKEWCRKNRRYLVVGGKDPAPGGNFYDTAFVVGPGGDIVFRQVKAVPIQFFKDGLPATEQKVWDSPWGKIGICVCYDLSYTRVTDRWSGSVRRRSSSPLWTSRTGAAPSMNCTRASHRPEPRSMACRSSASRVRASRSWLTALAESQPRLLAPGTAPPLPGQGAVA